MRDLSRYYNIATYSDYMRFVMYHISAWRQESAQRFAENACFILVFGSLEIRKRTEDVDAQLDLPESME